MKNVILSSVVFVLVLLGSVSAQNTVMTPKGLVSSNAVETVSEVDALLKQDLEDEIFAFNNAENQEVEMLQEEISYADLMDVAMEKEEDDSLLAFLESTEMTSFDFWFVSDDFDNY